MATDEPVTGGDIYALWEVAHKGLPTVEEVYNKALETHKNKVAGGDDKTFGRCFAAWEELRQHSEYLLSRTQGSLDGASKALDIAIDQFKYVDGDNAKGLTEAGKEFQGYLDEGISDPDHVDQDGEK